MVQKIIQELSERDCRLVAVSKTKSVADILKIYQQGQRAFGENRVQELLEKVDQLPKDIKWHLIGHLQRNKVKYIVPFVDLIHSVDSLKLMKEINKEGEKNERIVPVLIQIKIGMEESKFGVDPNNIDSFFEESFKLNLPWVQISGLMGIATFTENEEQIRNEFRGLKASFDQIKDKYFKDQDEFKELSMGMSSDYQIALEEGSTLVRIGSLIFGPRH